MNHSKLPPIRENQKPISEADYPSVSLRDGETPGRDIERIFEHPFSALEREYRGQGATGHLYEADTQLTDQEYHNVEPAGDIFYIANRGTHRDVYLDDGDTFIKNPSLQEINEARKNWVEKHMRCPDTGRNSIINTVDLYLEDSGYYDLMDEAVDDEEVVTKFEMEISEHKELFQSLVAERKYDTQVDYLWEDFGFRGGHAVNDLFENKEILPTAFIDEDKQFEEVEIIDLKNQEKLRFRAELDASIGFPVNDIAKELKGGRMEYQSSGPSKDEEYNVEINVDIPEDKVISEMERSLDSSPVETTI